MSDYLVNKVLSVKGCVTPPGSKSITNRALVISALADGISTLRGALESDDTHVMIESLRQLGFQIHHHTEESMIHVHGTGGKIPAKKADLFTGNSGTTIRFLTAMLTLAHGSFTLDGVERMRQRPIQDLLTALQTLGADVKTADNNGCPPVLINATGLHGGITYVAGNISSQYLSGLLMAAPLASSPVMIAVKGELVSRPYVDLTLEIMRHFGVYADEIATDITELCDEKCQLHSEECSKCPRSSQKNPTCPNSCPSPNSRPSERKTSYKSSENEKMNASLHAEHNGTGTSAEFIIPAPQSYRSCDYQIEPDASAASYFFAAAAVTGGEIMIKGLSKNSLQGDVGFCECLAKMGCSVTYRDDSITVKRDRNKKLQGIDVDMHHISDTAQTLCAVALYADGPTIIRNVANMRLKETDRIHAAATELMKFGALVEEFPDGLRITPPMPTTWEPTKKIYIDTWNDHRMAMSFSVAALGRGNVVISNIECTSKTYPDFFQDLENVIQR